MRSAHLITTVLILLVALNARAGTWVWAWDRSEDLRWLPPGVGVAWFAAHLDARDDTLAVSGRRAVLRVAPGTPRLPVLHIEAFDARHPPTLDRQAVGRWADTLATAIQRLGARRAQIDFEARAGQRDFYRAVLLALRERLPADVSLSITALASWCADPAWLASLPVSEVVPMYFRMGPAERQLWRRRMAQPATLPAVCRRAAGISIDEWQAMTGETGPELHEALADRQLYLFAPRPWRSHMLHELPFIPSTP